MTRYIKVHQKAGGYSWLTLPHEAQYRKVRKRTKNRYSSEGTDRNESVLTEEESTVGRI